jgi:hypothetical protein
VTAAFEFAVTALAITLILSCFLVFIDDGEPDFFPRELLFLILTVYSVLLAAYAGLAFGITCRLMTLIPSRAACIVAGVLYVAPLVLGGMLAAADGDDSYGRGQLLMLLGVAAYPSAACWCIYIRRSFRGRPDNVPVNHSGG